MWMHKQPAVAQKSLSFQHVSSVAPQTRWTSGHFDSKHSKRPPTKFDGLFNVFPLQKRYQL